MDITESFECSHFTQLPENLLKKFYVKDITTPRTTAFTFKDDGFFRTLKRKVKPIWEKNSGSAPTVQMKFIIDSLMTGFFIFMFSAARFNNYYFALIA
ncbi:Cytochrome b5-related protein, partial [Armadillidium nasatum]